MTQAKNKLKNIVINLLVLIVSVVIIFIFGEIVLRFYYYHEYRINILNGANQGLTIKDGELGWKIAKDLSYERNAKDALGKVYNIHVETNKDGFRIFDNFQSDKLKIFFLGDSYTADLTVSNDKTFYGVMKEMKKDIQVFAYGEGGYGSLQEFMILNEFIDLIKPNIIVWEFYENDFSDNDYELDMLKSFYNTGMPRPYIDLEGKITYRYAKYDNWFIDLPSLISENIRLLKVINKQLSFLINAGFKKKAILDEIAQEGEAHKGFRHSIEITKLIMSMVKKRAGEIPVYLFSITDRQPFYDAIKNISRSVGIHFIDGVPQRLNKFENQRPSITKASDRVHLNELGNRIIAEKLIEYFEENKIMN
jgi:hypothetical protein